jgi:hypothetical protein
MGLDRIIFALGGAGRRPLMLTGEDYQRVLEEEGLDVRQVRFRNRLPLAHRLVIGVKGQTTELQQATTDHKRRWSVPPANRSGTAGLRPAGKLKHAPPKASGSRQ